MSYGAHNMKRKKYFMSENMFPQTIDVVRTKAAALDIELVVGKLEDFDWDNATEYMGLMVQNPDNFGTVHDFSELAKKVKESKCVFTIAADLLCMNLVKPPGEMGADIALGSSQRMGIPMAFGGPHPGFFATTDKFKRRIPGRLIGVSIDRLGNQAYRMALQTREQHIRRDKATSNICTA